MEAFNFTIKTITPAKYTNEWYAFRTKVWEQENNLKGYSGYYLSPVTLGNDIQLDIVIQ